ncbi:MAG: RtcB family protein [Clostridia bacterium]|nr:RtcB family protein [Clostridia bacterium]
MIYASSVDSASYAQVLRMCNMEPLQDSRIAMMPDMHAAEGCTVGTSMTIGQRVNPAFVGGDIGCGMQVYRFSDTSVDFPALDACIRSRIPAGARIHDTGLAGIRSVPLEKLHCYEYIRHETVLKSYGSLGGGNHFIEMARGTDDKLYLILHSGSRRLGRDVAQYHQVQAFFEQHGIDSAEAKKKKLKVSDIKSSIHPTDCFLSGENLSRYLQDMNIAVEYAARSRMEMGEIIIHAFGLKVEDQFATIHNYIDTAAKVLRKGAVSAQKGERLLIPINMSDGSLLCTGKGNNEWNCTAPHGSGRVMKRSEAKQQISLEDYRKEMEGIFTTSVGESTLDESPMAYRRIDEILDAIEPTAAVDDVLTPVYNFKASQPVTDEEVMDGED